MLSLEFVQGLAGGGPLLPVGGPSPSASFWKSITAKLSSLSTLSQSTLPGLETEWRGVAVTLIQMIATTMGDAYDHTELFRDQAYPILSHQGWQRHNGAGELVDMGSKADSYAGIPDLYILPSAGVGVFAFRGLRSLDASGVDACASLATFGWHATFNALPNTCGLLQAASLDYLRSSKASVEVAIARSRPQGIHHFLVTGHSLGGAVGLLMASQMTPPLPVVAFGPGGWRSALLNRTSAGLDGGLDQLYTRAAAIAERSVSVVNTWDPVAGYARSDGELFGRVLNYSEVSPSETTLSTCSQCRSSKTSCSPCVKAVHAIDRYYTLMTGDSHAVLQVVH